MNGAATMESERSHGDQVVHERARQLGYTSSNCDTCGALGRTEPRIEPSESDGLASEATCPDCGGSGRWWFPDLRALGCPPRTSRTRSFASCCAPRRRRERRMATKGSTYRSEANTTLRTVCAHCGKAIPTETGNAHPLDEAVRRETYGLAGDRGGREATFATCAACQRPAGGRRPSSRWRIAGAEPCRGRDDEDERSHSQRRDARQSPAAPVRHRHVHHRPVRRDRRRVPGARLHRARDERRRAAATRTRRASASRSPRTISRPTGAPRTS